MTAAVLCIRPAARAGPVDPTLSPGDVTKLVSRCVTYAKRVRGKPNLTIGVVDREGNSLGVFHMPGSTGSLSVALAGTGALLVRDMSDLPKCRRGQQ